MEDGNSRHSIKEKSSSSVAPEEMGREDGIENNVDQRPLSNTSLSSLSWFILCSSMLLAELQAALDTTITANLQPTIIETFGEIAKLPWINVTYSLGMGGSCLFWGKLLLCFDSKKILLISIMLFAIGSTLNAAAPSMNVFIVGKAITGIGSSGTYISVIKIITAFTFGSKQGRYFGYIGFTWGLGTILGPCIGGAFAGSKAGWRWSFYFNLILVGVNLPVFMFILPPQQNSTMPGNTWIRVRRIDFLGSSLLTGTLCSVIMAVSFGGIVYPWNSGVIIGLFCCSGFLCLAFGIQQATTTLTTEDDRVLPVHILQSWEMWNLIIQTGCSISMLFITIYYIPLYFQFVRGESATRSAVALLPFLLSSVFAMLTSGRLISSLGYYKAWFMAGSCLALIMSVCLYTTDINTSNGAIYGYLIIGGVGTGLFAMNSAPVMSAIVRKEHIADASIVFGCVDALCGAFSVGIANSVFLNRAEDSIQEILPDTPRATVQDAIAGIGDSLTRELPSSVKIAVLRATLDAIKDAWIQMIATATLSFVLSFFLRNRKLSDLS